MKNTESSKWETDVIDKLARLIKKSGKSLDHVFSQIDTDKSGLLNRKEFHKAMKLINTGFTTVEMDKIMQRVDSNNDGVISYIEFASKFRIDQEFEERMRKRANNKLTALKQQMVMHMSSPVEAFNLVSILKILISNILCSNI